MDIIAPNDTGNPVCTVFPLANGNTEGGDLYLKMVDTLLRHVG